MRRKEIVDWILAIILCFTVMFSIRWILENVFIVGLIFAISIVVVFVVVFAIIFFGKIDENSYNEMISHLPDSQKNNPDKSEGTDLDTIIKIKSTEIKICPEGTAGRRAQEKIMEVYLKWYCAVNTKTESDDFYEIIEAFDWNKSTGMEDYSVNESDIILVPTNDIYECQMDQNTIISFTLPTIERDYFMDKSLLAEFITERYSHKTTKFQGRKFRHYNVMGLKTSYNINSQMNPTKARERYSNAKKPNYVALDSRLRNKELIRDRLNAHLFDYLERNNYHQGDEVYSAKIDELLDEFCPEERAKNGSVIGEVWSEIENMIRYPTESSFIGVY